MSYIKNLRGKKRYAGTVHVTPSGRSDYSPGKDIPGLQEGNKTACGKVGDRRTGKDFRRGKEPGIQDNHGVFVGSGVG